MRLVKFLVFSCFIFLFLTSTFVIKAEEIQLSVAPASVNFGELVTVNVTNLPLQTAGYILRVKPSSTSADNDIVAYLQIIISGGACRSHNTSAAWVSPVCSGTGPFTFSGKIDTSNPELTAKDIKGDGSYSVFLGGSSTGSSLAEKSFIIKASGGTATFNISSITPNPAKPGETISINLSNAKLGTFHYGLSVGQLNSVSCTTSNCSLPLTIPPDTTSPTVNILVYDPDNNSKSASLAMTLPTPIDSTLKVTIDPPQVLSCSDEDKTAGKCTTATGVTCNPETGAQGSGDGIWTAIGCIPTNPPVLIQKLLGFAASLGGGVSLLMMIYGGFLWITSGGNPDNLKKASDHFINAAIGLLFIIFSLMFLKIIGVDILQIPGFAP